MYPCSTNNSAIRVSHFPLPMPCTILKITEIPFTTWKHHCSITCNTVFLKFPCIRFTCWIVPSYLPVRHAANQSSCICTPSRDRVSCVGIVSESFVSPENGVTTGTPCIIYNNNRCVTRIFINRPSELHFGYSIKVGRETG